MSGPATLHEARSTLPQLIRAAGAGVVTPLARGAHHAALTAPADAPALGWDLTRAAVHGIADARKKLGDLIQLAAEGRPQVLRRHTTPVAVLLPATPGGAPLSAETFALGGTPAVAPPAGPATEPAPVAPRAAVAPAPAPAAAVPPPTATPSQADAIPGLPMTYGPATLTTPTNPPTTPTTAGPGASSARSAVTHPTSAAPPSLASVPVPGSAPGRALAPTPASAPAPRILSVFGDVLDSVLAPTPSSPDAPGPALPALGIRTLDAVLGGLQPGRFYLVAAAPGAGGSLIASAAARTTALERHLPVLYAASGLSRTDVAARIVAGHLPVDYRRLRSGRLTAEEHGDAQILYGELAAAPLYIDDGADLTAAAVADSAVDLPGLALVVVDRFQLAEDPRLPLSGPAAVTDAAQALAHLARTRHVPIVAVLDTDDPRLVDAASLDVTVFLVRDGDWVHATVTERDLGAQGDAVLYADLAHARLLDPPAARPAPFQAGPAPSPASPPGRPVPGAVAPNSPTAPPPSANTPTAPGAWPAVTPPGSAPSPGPGRVPGPPQGALALAARSEAASADALFDGTSDPESGTSAPAPSQRDASRGPASSRTSSLPSSRISSRAPSRAGSSDGYAGRDYSHFTDMITRAVDQALADHGGDIEAATEALVKKAIPNAMALFEATRVGSNYDHTVYPELPDFLRKKTRDGVDEIWEGRHNWTNNPLMDDLQAGNRPPVTVDVLDTNAAFLSAFKAHLPIGKLVHDPNGGFDPRRSGVYLLNSRPTWEHPDLPDPIGNRREEGPVILDDATVRLLARCAKLGLCEEPSIAESWTSGASEGLLEKFRRVLTEAREKAVMSGDTVTVEYVKAMYAKFVSTLGESSANREIRRPEWMHILRSQAFANLWYKGHRAHTHGLTIVRMRGTDELHVTGGDWRDVFPEGRLTTQLKLKGQYDIPRKAA